MKLKSWLVIGALALVAVSSAQGRIVFKMRNTASPFTLVHPHFRVIDATSNAPFGLAIPQGGKTLVQAEAALLANAAVEWVEEEGECETPEGLDQQGAKASVIPVVFDRTFISVRNTMFLSFINYSAFNPVNSRVVKVGILDTGLSLRQPKLWANVLGSRNFVAPSNADDAPVNLDSNGNGLKDEGAGHGTMVTGLIQQVAPNAKYLIAKVADSDGNATSWTVIKGLAYVVANGAEVVNISLGTRDPLRALGEVTSWAKDRSVTVIAAAGNGNRSPIYFPAESSGCFAITGLSLNNTKASFSNWGSSAMIAAPAVGLTSAWWDGTCASFSGTSFASPLVAGAIADTLKGTSPKLPSDLKRAINKSCPSVDNWNPAFRGKLGLKLDVTALRNEILNPSP
jgi:subtilisin family serine protease